YLGLFHTFELACSVDKFPFGLNDCIEDTQFYNVQEYATPQKSLSKIYYECGTNYLLPTTITWTITEVLYQKHSLHIMASPTTNETG
ncbi:hypothetical protein, partial [Nocardia puris]|uniref:hypothetical protein n=1 Tax=Nocardia puris TaxID=208602 RepID=UPI001E2C8996